MTARPTGLPLALCPAALTRAAATVLAAWRQRRRTRRHLVGLDARQLRDIGITEADRRRECAKWFWQV